MMADLCDSQSQKVISSSPSTGDRIRGMRTPIASIAAAIVMAVGLMLAAAPPAAGQTAAWVGSTGLWSNEDNWACDPGDDDGDCVPNGANLAVSMDNGGYAVLDINATTKTFFLYSGTLSVIGGGVLTNTEEDVIGALGSGTLTIKNGGIVNDFVALVALGPVSSGTVTVTGSGSEWNLSGGVVVGGDVDTGGQGTLTIADGGVVGAPTVSIPGSGAATVTDPGSKMSVNTVGVTGALTIANGGQLNVGGQLTVGAPGLVKVTGPGSQLNGSQATVTVVGGNLTVQQSAQASSASLVVDGAAGFTGSMVLTDPNTVWNNGMGDLTVGDQGSGGLVVQSGAILNHSGATLVIGRQAGSSGTVIVSGAGSQLNAPNSSLDVGDLGIGSLTIENGAVAHSNYGGIALDRALGGVTVSGTGSKWSMSNSLGVGVVGEGTLTVQQGGRVVSIGLDIGQLSGANGTVTLDGANSLYTNGAGGYVMVGDAGTGTLTIQNGAVLKDNAGLGVGNAATGNGTVTIDNGGELDTVGAAVGISGRGQLQVSGAGSSVYSAGQINIGGNSGGVGSLVIDDGGMVTDQGGVIGLNAGSTGTVLVTDTGSTWANGTKLDIGVNGKGSLTVQGGAVVSAGTLTSPGTITIGPQGYVDDKGGTLQGTVVVQQGGTLDPLGVASIVGDFTLDPGGTLSLDVAGTGNGQFGVLDVSGFGTYDGTLSLDFMGGFAPQQGETFDFINDPGGASIDFGAVDILGLQPGADGQFTLMALNNGISSSPTPEPGALALLGLGLFGLAYAYRKRRRVR